MVSELLTPTVSALFFKQSFALGPQEERLCQTVPECKVKCSTNLLESEKPVFQLRLVASDWQGCCCRFSCSDCTQQPKAPSLRNTDQQRTCRGSYKSSRKKPTHPQRHKGLRLIERKNKNSGSEVEGRPDC